MIDIDISKNIQTCEIKAKCLKQYIEKDHHMLEAFETFVKKYPVLRMNYLMKPGKLLLIKPQKIEELKNQIHVYKRKK